MKYIVVFFAIILCNCSAHRDDVNDGCHLFDSGQNEKLATTPHDLELMSKVISDVVINDDISSSREFYGLNAKTLVLKSFGSSIEWPKELNIAIIGWTVTRNPHKVIGESAIGLDLRYYGIPREQDWFDKVGNYRIIEMSMYSAINIGTIGAANIKYLINLDTGEVRFHGLSDA